MSYEYFKIKVRYILHNMNSFKDQRQNTVNGLTLRWLIVQFTLILKLIR